MTLPDDVASEPGDDPIVVAGHFDATPAEVFQAWTDPAIVKQWFGRAPNALHSATIDLREGGAWRFLETSIEQKSVGFEGTYIVIEPNARLVFTWSKVVAYATGERDATPTSQVDVTFSPRGDGTDVRLVHSQVHDEETRNAFSGGWAFAFNTMRALLSSS